MTSFLRFLLLTFAVLTLTLPRAGAQSKADNPDGVKSLEFFVGDWHCDGKFPSTGKAIRANLHFESILDGKFLFFKHDDEPPFNYHAHSYWGWDQVAKQFVSTVHDSMGGTRFFRSTGWEGKTLNWLGGTDQKFKFTFERLEDKKFRVSYSFIRNGGWVAVDTSVCTSTSK